MAPTSDLGALEIELSRLLRRARSAQQRTALDVHPDLDSAGYAVLVAIRDLAATGGGARGGDISDLLGLHKSTTSRNLTTLEDLGLIERIPDPLDARARQVRLTASGAEALERSVSGRRERLRARLADWEAQDVSDLARLLRQLNDTAP